MWNTEEDPGNSVGHVGELEPFLNHHMILLDNSGADKALCVVSQLRFLARGYFIRFDHILPQVHWSKPHPKGYDGKLVRWLILDGREKSGSAAVNTMDAELVRSWAVYT